MDGLCKRAVKRYGELLQRLKAISYSLHCYLDLDLDTQAFTKTCGLQIVIRALDSMLLAMLRLPNLDHTLRQLCNNAVCTGKCPNNKGY